MAPAVKAIVSQQVDPRIAADLKAFDFHKIVDNTIVDRLVKDGFFQKLFGPGIKAEEQSKAKLALEASLGPGRGGPSGPHCSEPGPAGPRQDGRMHKLRHQWTDQALLRRA